MSLPRTLAVDDLPAWPPAGQTQTVEITVGPGLPFEEAIISWNVADVGGSRLEVRARTVREVGPGPWRSLGHWSGAGRSSAPVVRDEQGAVVTDVVRTAQPALALQLRLTMIRAAGERSPSFKMLTVCFDGDRPDRDAGPDPSSNALEVPQVFQLAYPRGNVLCSPASLAMVLGYWAERENRAEWRREVPEIEAGVWDPEYRGAGNWSFNAAYAGAMPGMCAFVSRLASVAELEVWIGRGAPVIASVALSLLRAKPLSVKESGHLVVVTGFGEDGTVLLNDPAREAVALRVPRADFERAWDYSRRTVYFVHPEGWARPPAPEGRWP